MPVNQSVQVEALDGSELIVAGETVNFSGMGMGLRLAIPFRVGTPISIRIGKDILVGTVKECVDSYPGYRVGLQLEQFLSASAIPVLRQKPIDGTEKVAGA